MYKISYLGGGQRVERGLTQLARNVIVLTWLEYSVTVYVISLAFSWMNSLRTKMFFSPGRLVLQQLLLHSEQLKLGKSPEARRYSLHESREVWRWCEGSLGDNGKAREKAICPPRLAPSRWLNITANCESEVQCMSDWWLNPYHLRSLIQQFTGSASLFPEVATEQLETFLQLEVWLPSNGTSPAVISLSLTWLCQIALSKIVVMATWPLFNL